MVLPIGIAYFHLYVKTKRGNDAAIYQCVWNWIQINSNASQIVWITLESNCWICWNEWDNIWSSAIFEISAIRFHEASGLVAHQVESLPRSGLILDQWCVMRIFSFNTSRSQLIEEEEKKQYSHYFLIHLNEVDNILRIVFFPGHAKWFVIAAFFFNSPAHMHVVLILFLHSNRKKTVG